MGRQISCAPIALFVYNRPGHTRQAVEALAGNELAEASDLFVFSDGPRSAGDREMVEAVRQYLPTITGFRSLTIVERETNFGCARSITAGITEIVNRFGRIVVIEDDIVTSRYFLRFMNEALELYRDDGRVACVHGYLYPLAEQLPETFFVRGADIWGWGTWKRGWDLYEADAQKLLEAAGRLGLVRELEARGYLGLLQKQIAGAIDTWDVQWCVSAFNQGKLTLYPGRSLVKNIGYDNSGTHCRTSERYAVDLTDAPVAVTRIEAVEDQRARRAIGAFLRSANQGRLPGLVGRVLHLIGKGRAA